MKKQCLNGLWSYRIGKGEWTQKQIPFSAIPVGHSECYRRFDLEETAERVILRFDGITYAAKVFLNGVQVGEMLPYCEYSFDISNNVKPKGNELLVELEDITPTFGPSEGWGNYGGIIRGVSLLYAGESGIEDCFFHAQLTENYTAACYTVETTLRKAEGCDLEISLWREAEQVDGFRCPADASPVSRELQSVKLWSPEAPERYLLRVDLLRNGAVLDTYECMVGFREFTCDQHRFLLNGQPIFLLGVCKHEMIGESGHTPSPEAIEADLLRIKSCGCNYVRLVHYPHCKETLEIADRIGLLVSEEPGLWWSDTANPEISAGSQEVLRRTILRDRNHPSVAFWLCFNECRFTEEFLVRSAEICRETDPTRLVSGANCMSIEETLIYYNRCGFDFYTMHPYSNTFDRPREAIQKLKDKPLMFTEWGGYFVYDNPHLLDDFIQEMYRYYQQGDDDGALTGASFWYWSEVNDFNRGAPACVDGTLKEALVDREGRPTLIYDAFCAAWKKAKGLVQGKIPYEFVPQASISGVPMQCNVKGDPAEILRTLIEYEDNVRKGERPRKLKNGPVLAKEEWKGLPSVPVMLSDGGEIVFTGEKKTSQVELIGAVSATAGYPLSGTWGDLAATVTVEFTDGTTEAFPLRNGMEFTTLHLTWRSSLIHPVAQYATPLAHFSYDKNFEIYQINRLVLSLSAEKQVCRVIITSCNCGYRLLFWGATL